MNASRPLRGRRRDAFTRASINPTHDTPPPSWCTRSPPFIDVLTRIDSGVHLGAARILHEHRDAPWHGNETASGVPLSRADVNAAIVGFQARLRAHLDEVLEGKPASSKAHPDFAAFRDTLFEVIFEAEPAHTGASSTPRRTG